MNAKLLVNIGWLATPQPFDSQELYTIETLDADALLIEGETITWIGKEKDYQGPSNAERIDLDGRGITPGFIDFHAHPVFATTRAEEFQLRTKGASYQEIAAAGGGILNSTKKVAAASEEELASFSRRFLDNALTHGTTTLEAKSGYGLSPETEYKLLRTIRTLNETHPLDLVPTFLGAHEYPLEYKENHEGYIKLLTEEMIPTVAKENLAEACDIFCETGVFSIEDARRILTCAKEHGLKIKVHADQLTPLGGSKLAAELGALSADHIEFIDDESIRAMKESGTVAGLLPSASHFLRMEQDPPVRKMIENGVICALATDFNPGSAMSENMQMTVHFGVIRFRISAEEALWMATAGSAIALDKKDRGVIAPGYLADLVAWDMDSLAQMPYHFGINHVSDVFKRGTQVVREGRLVG